MNNRREGPAGRVFERRDDPGVVVARQHERLTRRTDVNAPLREPEAQLEGAVAERPLQSFLRLLLRGGLGRAAKEAADGGPGKAAPEQPEQKRQRDGEDKRQQRPVRRRLEPSRG